MFDGIQKEVKILFHFFSPSVYLLLLRFVFCLHLTLSILFIFSFVYILMSVFSYLHLDSNFVL